MKSLNRTRSIGFKTQEDLTGHVVAVFAHEHEFNYENATCLLQVLKIIMVRYILYPELDTSMTLKARCGGLAANLHDKLGNIA